MPEIPLTIQQIRDGLHSGFSLDETDQFTFSIPDADSFWETTAGNYEGSNLQPTTDYSVLTAAQADNFRDALAAWDALIAPDFTEVADTAVSHGEVRVAFTSLNMTGFAGYAFQGSNQTPTSIVGDVWLNSDDTGQSYDVGTNDYATLLHELGHVLGLKHPFVPTVIPDPYDTTRYTVMSYTDAGSLVTFGGGGLSISSTVSAVPIATPMVLDIAAVQDLYGVDTGTNTGDTVYTFNQNDVFLQSIYDAGGTDTFDLSSITRNNIVDLTPGAYSSVAQFTVDEQKAYWKPFYNSGLHSFIDDTYTATPDAYTWTDNVGIAFTTTIENVLGGSAIDIMFGNSAVNTLTGNGGNDYLDGGGGDDVLVGGLGDDTYYVDAAGDAITELAGQGTDRVAADASYTLAAGVSIEQLDAEHSTATTALTLTGNDLAQTIIGNAGINTLNGGGDNDVLVGLAGGDTLNGGSGNDILIGGSGNNILDGGTGDDTFYIEDPDDTVAEATGEGTDRVAVLMSYTLTAGAEVERLDAINLTGTGVTTLTGNEFGQTIIGDAGANTLNGMGGNDVLVGYSGDDDLSGGDGDDVLIGGAGSDDMAGGDGNDTYVVEDAGDAITEVAGEGTSDRVATSISFVLGAGIAVERIEAITLSASTAMNLTGNDLGNIISGNAGVNVLDGKGGNDVLYGGGGADTFRFSTALGVNNVDKLEDVATGVDEIELDNAVFTALSDGALPAGAFNTGLLGVATQADDRIIYDTVTGALYYDADGSGLAFSAVQFAVLAGAPSIGAGDFTVI